MNHIEDICQAITDDLTSDTFNFYKGTKPDQNFDLDELDFETKNGAVIYELNKPIKWKYTASNYREGKATIFLFIAYKAGMDEHTSDQFDAYVKKARLAADEFILRLRSHDSIKDIDGEPEILDIYNVGDINLTGVTVDVTAIVKNNDSSCLS